MADVFISYAHQDADIAHDLEARGYTTWRYEAKSLLGGSYLERIDREIEGCRAALFVISAASLASPQCKSETVRAHELGKPLLPLRRDIDDIFLAYPIVGADKADGLVLGTRSRIERLSEEHGVIRVEKGDRFRVGQRVRVLPNHACAVSNLHDRLAAVRGGSVEGEIRVAARGRVQ